MIVSWLSNGNASLKRYVRNVPLAKIGFAGPVANVPLLVFSTNNTFALNSPNRLMFVMAAHNAVNVPWRNIYTKPLMLKKSMNWSEANPDPVLPFQKVNSDR